VHVAELTNDGRSSDSSGWSFWWKMDGFGPQIFEAFLCYLW
jgi:hypothetical protein